MRIVIWACAIGLVLITAIATLTDGRQKMAFHYVTPDDTFTPDAIYTPMPCSQFRVKLDCVWHNRYAR